METTVTGNNNNPAPTQGAEVVDTSKMNQQEYEAHMNKLEVQRIKEQQGKVSALLEKYKGSIANALPSMLTPERMIRVALSAMSKTPALMDCTQHSLMGSILTCAQLGLMPDGITGEAYLIPFKNTKKGILECNVIIGYKGLITLAHRSGLVKSIQARPVFEGDFFEYELGLNEVLKHKPGSCVDQKKITHFYCVVKFTNGGYALDVMTAEQVNAVRDGSANWKSTKYKDDLIWTKHYAEMGAKTVTRKLMKFVPLSPEITRAVALDERADIGNQKIQLEVLDDLATKEDMQDAVYAEEVDETNATAGEKKEEIVDTRNDKVKKAQDDLLKTLNTKPGDKKEEKKK